MMRSHISPALLDLYAAGGSASTPDVWWAVESHLEICPSCRDRLGEAVSRLSPETTDLIERVRLRLATEVARTPAVPAAPRWRPRSRWLAPALLPRLATTAAVVLAAVGLDLADTFSRPSLVLLLAPVAPLLGVAAAWSRGVDPAYELVVSSPRAGLDLVLRRTLAVLLAVIPVLGVAGWVVGASPVLWLVPCLAFTVGALALGEFIGLHRAATGLAAAWAVLVVAPSFAVGRTPVLLDRPSLPAWVAVIAVTATVLVLRRRAYTRLLSGQ